MKGILGTEEKGEGIPGGGHSMCKDMGMEKLAPERFFYISAAICSRIMMAS